MLKPLRCDFLTGPLTNSESMDQLKYSFEQQNASIHEMLYYKKNGTGIWVEVKIVPLTIYNVTYRYWNEFMSVITNQNNLDSINQYWCLSCNLVNIIKLQHQEFFLDGIVISNNCQSVTN